MAIHLFAGTWQQEALISEDAVRLQEEVRARPLEVPPPVLQMRATWEYTITGPVAAQDDIVLTTEPINMPEYVFRWVGENIDTYFSDATVQGGGSLFSTGQAGLVFPISTSSPVRTWRVLKALALVRTYHGPGVFVSVESIGVDARYGRGVADELNWQSGASLNPQISLRPLNGWAANNDVCLSAELRYFGWPEALDHYSTLRVPQLYR